VRWDSICVGEVGSICGQSCNGANGSCDHDVCAAGATLATTCSSCADKVCANDAYCCNTGWDDICVGEVPSACASQTCP
jgi:hypothetical protein